MKHEEACFLPAVVTSSVIRSPGWPHPISSRACGRMLTGNPFQRVFSWPCGKGQKRVTLSITGPRPNPSTVPSGAPESAHSLDVIAATFHAVQSRNACPCHGLSLDVISPKKQDVWLPTNLMAKPRNSVLPMVTLGPVGPLLAWTSPMAPDFPPFLLYQSPGHWSVSHISNMSLTLKNCCAGLQCFFLTNPLWPFVAWTGTTHRQICLLHKQPPNS